MHLCSYISPLWLTPNIIQLMGTSCGTPSHLVMRPVKQSKIKEALAKYDEGLKHAPNWKKQGIARGNGAVRPN
jgi:hypothetical protein